MEVLGQCIEYTNTVYDNALWPIGDSDKFLVHVPVAMNLTNHAVTTNSCINEEINPLKGRVVNWLHYAIQV